MTAITILKCYFSPTECAALNAINYLDYNVEPNTEVSLSRSEFVDIMDKLQSYLINGFFIDYRLECHNLWETMHQTLERYK